MAANFIGCEVAISRADSSPVTIVMTVKTSPKIEPTRILFLAKITSLFLIKYQALIPITNTAERMYAE